MTIEPQAALNALVELLKRCPMNQAEAIGASQCAEILRTALTPQPPVKSE